MAQCLRDLFSGREDSIDAEAGAFVIATALITYLTPAKKGRGG